MEQAQGEASEGYRKYLYTRPVFAKKFQVLLASSMLWRGLYDDVLATLADDRLTWANREDLIQRSSLQATALIFLHRLSEADRALANADGLCGLGYSQRCGMVILAHGLLLLQRGQAEQAERFFDDSLNFARSNQDGGLEAAALQNLGRISSQLERHDKALEYYHLAAAKAEQLGDLNLQQKSLGSEGWEQYTMGNPEKALEAFAEAERRAASLGNLDSQALWLNTSARAFAAIGQISRAEEADLHALQLARRINKKSTLVDASMDLSRLYIGLGRPDDADRFSAQARSLALETGSPVDQLTCDLLIGEAALLHHDDVRARRLLEKVSVAADSQPSMKWQAEQALGRMYETQGDMASAQRAYETALGLVEGARADLNQEVSQLTFLENASSIYDDYIHLLVSEGKTQEALEAADWSRARTLQQGLSLTKSATRTVSGSFTAAPKLKQAEIARKANASLLFYWLGERQSYLWVITPERTQWVALPPRSELLPAIERYKFAILSLKDPLKANDSEAAKDASSLYRDLIFPAAGQLRQDRPVVLFVDGEMGQLNFESLVVPSPSPHFWIEDATVLSAPSIRMFAESLRTSPALGKSEPKMLLFGDATPSGTEFRPLPMAALEMEKVKRYFPGTAQVFQGAHATPAAYLASTLEKFQYIHFVTHGTASRTDPLESAVILSQGGSGEDAYKLYAREILRHPINAQLVTISACNSSGSKSFAGEGMVGLSWAFLRAGAHNAIGSLWEVSDASTPELMGTLYQQLSRGQAPAAALRSAKLSLIHSGGRFTRPFYWAPFQLYAGR